MLVRANDGVEVGDVMLYEVRDDVGACRLALTPVDERMLAIGVRYEEGVASADVNGRHAQRGRRLRRWRRRADRGRCNNACCSHRGDCHSDNYNRK